GDAVIRDRRRERQAGDQLALAIVEPDFELALRGRRWPQVDRVTIAADLEVERELADARADPGDCRQIRALEDPAGLHDVDQEYRALAAEWRVVLEVQDQFVGAGAQLLAAAPPEAGLGRRAKCRVCGHEA